MSIIGKKQEIVDNYSCYDQYGETCESDCKNCAKDLLEDLNALEKEIRADERLNVLEYLSRNGYIRFGFEPSYFMERMGKDGV